METPRTFTQEEHDAELARVRDGLTTDLKAERVARQDAERQRREQDERLKALETEAQKANSERERISLEGKGEYDKALQKVKDEYDRKLAEIAKQGADKDARITSMLVDGEILKYAGDAIDPQDVLALMKGAYRFDVTAAGVSVKKPDGTPLLGADGKEADVAGAVQQFLGTKPHLVKAGGTGGAGSTGGGRTPSPQGLEAQIEAAHAAGDTHRVIMLKARQQSAVGPHAQRNLTQKQGT